MPGLRQGSKRRMLKFLMSEMSSVDFPAQEGAKAVILKRRDEVVKNLGEEPTLVIMTSTEDGHSHILWLHAGMRGGETSYGTAPESEHSHDHPWILNPDGTITIGTNDGHDHTVDPQQIFMMVMNKRKEPELQLVSSEQLMDDFAIKVVEPADPEDSMPQNDPTPEQLQALNTAITDAVTKATEELTARADRAEKVAELTDAQRAHFDTLDEDGQTEFLGKSKEEREAAIAKRSEDNPVVYTDGYGDEYRKNDDPRLVRLAKERDADRLRIAKQEAALEDERLSKRAAETLPNLPGEVKVRGAILKALDGIEDETVRQAAHEAVVAGDKAIKAAFSTVGAAGNGTVEVGDAEAELDRLAKARQAEKGEDYFTAYDAVAEASPELAKRAIDGK